MPKSRLSTMSIAALREEIERRRKELPELIARREALNQQIAELQGLAVPKASKTAQPKAAPQRVRRRQPASNKVGLADALAAFMEGKKKVTVGEAMEGVLAAGYHSNARNFRSVVNNMLLTDKRFKAVARGVFTLKR